MEFPILYVVLLLSLFMIPAVSDPRAEVAALICANVSASTADRQVFVATFLEAMDAVTPLVYRQRYGGVINGTGNTTVYAFGECMKDLSQDDCKLCFARCKTQILRCLPFQRLTRGGRLFSDGCYLRYDDYMFFNESLSAVDRTVCGDVDFGGNRTVFRANVVQLVKNLSVEGPRNDGFYTGFVNRGNVSVYGLAQCWELLSTRGCEQCLGNSIAKIDSCPPKEEGRVLNAGCYVRYSTNKFYDNSTSDAAARNRGRRRGLATIVAAVSGAVAFVLFASAITFFVRKKLVKQRREKKQLGALRVAVNKSKLNFSYDTLEKATNYFHDSNKLGEGGSGSVYKGILPGGQVVAIKRLFFNTRQWVDHFFNEVNLISGINHKNLVKLLGCSITGPESLLVYEYLPNQSLHDYLFAKKNSQSLRWEERYKIVLGTAEGLAFLHEGSEVRIIHRDIKLSNVLLDEDLTPKIADFGLARLFPEDETHISTAIAGTLGYMAPEYVVRGMLTEKADVYSFGVLVIELVCGRRNNAFAQNSYSILQMVWNFYEKGNLSEAVDTLLGGNYHVEEASRLLRIGLICVQASAELRPSMSVIVKMITDNHDIPQPTQPPFLHSSGAEASQFSQPGTQCSQPASSTLSWGNSMTESWVEPR